MDIKECNSRDFSGVFRLLEQLWPDLDLDFHRQQAVFDAYVEGDADVPLVAWVDRRIVGFASLNIRNSLWRTGTIAYLDTLIVDEEHKRAGVGAALVERAEDMARDRGCTYVELDSAFHRKDAHEFYEALGYERLGIMFGKRL
jgi:glucosamine-phosphate N-acetyltransferase